MIHTDTKYALLLSNRFRNFKTKNSVYNFSCPYCGDSSRNKFKARGYLIEKQGKLMFYCHNCSISKGFDGFLYDQDQNLYRQYKLEKLADSGQTSYVEEISKDTPKVTTQAFPGYRRAGSPLRKLKSVSQLAHDHPVKQYILDRSIPNEYHYKLFYCPKFYAWTNLLLPGKFEKVEKDEPRLIIPFVDHKQNFFGYQGRALSSKSNLRYITIMLDERKPKIYGLDTIDDSKTVYVVEGPIDSMFVGNCVAMAGSDTNLDFDDVVMVYDNEPRNAEIIKKIEKSIDMGRKVVVWPSKIHEKDINDMIMTGMSRADLKLIIDQNTHKGLSAKMALSVWRKV